MVVDKNGFDPFLKDAFGSSIDPPLVVPHSAATVSLFLIQCKVHPFCLKFHLGILFLSLFFNSFVNFLLFESGHIVSMKIWSF